MYCNQCGKEIPNTNTFHINYEGVSMIVCGKHYSQYLRFHKFLDDSKRSMFDANEFEIIDEGVWIYCFNRKNEPSGKFLIDRCDLDEVIKKKWRFWKGQYCTGNFQPIQIHQFLLHPNNDQVVDHINGNRADNRRCNLRVTTQAKNTINRALSTNNTSGIAGVCWDKARKRWAPEIKMDGIKCHLGRYIKIEDAVYARYLAELILFKEFRSTRNDDRILEYVDHCNNKDNIKNYVIKKLQSKYFLEVNIAC